MRGAAWCSTYNGDNVDDIQLQGAAMMIVISYFALPNSMNAMIFCLSYFLYLS